MSRMPRVLSKNNVIIEPSQILSEIHTFGINSLTREIYLNGDLNENITDGGGVDFRCAAPFLRNMDYLEHQSSKPITIKMCLSGGDTTYGYAIYDRIANAKCHVTIECFGHASSMSGIIFQAADWRIMAKHSHYLLHYGSIEIAGNSIDVSENIKMNDKDNVIMLKLFAERCMKSKTFEGWTLNKVMKFLDDAMRKKGDLFLSPEEALAWGLCDEVV